MATGTCGSDEYINIKCCLCEKKNISKEADTYCMECQDYYCSPCTDLHKMFPSAVGVHQFIDLSSLNTAGLQKTIPSFQVERCAVHKYKLLDMYCADHSEIVCVTCVAINHRACQNVHSVQDEVDNLLEKINIDKTNKDLTKMKAKMNDAKQAKEILLKQLQEQKAKAEESIKEFRRQMDEILDTLESESRRKLEGKYKYLKEKLENDINKLQKHVDELNISWKQLQTGNKVQQFVSLTKAKKQITEMITEETSLTSKPICNIEFTADSKIKDVFKTFEAFGLVSVNETKSFRYKFYSVKLKKNINIRYRNDRSECNIYGSCFTDYGHLLLADYENKLDDVSSKSIKDVINLDETPSVVCRTNKDEAAVSLNNNTIQIISLANGRLKTTKQLKLDHLPFGLACTNGKLFTSDQRKSLSIYDMKGTLIRKITNDNQGREIFHGNRHICVSSDGNLIYVTDPSKGLVVLDLNGNYKTTITDPDLSQLWGVCTDKDGNMFVCGWGKSKIVQINEQSFENLGELGNVGNSTSICFDPRQKRLVVTTWKSNFIKVYDLD